MDTDVDANTCAFPFSVSVKSHPTQGAEGLFTQTKFRIFSSVCSTDVQQILGKLRAISNTKRHWTRKKATTVSPPPPGLIS